MYNLDIYNNLEPLDIYVAKPDGTIIGRINDEIDETTSSMTVGVNSQYQLSFTMRKNLDGVSLIEYMQEGMQLLVDKVGWFKLNQPSIILDGVSETREIEAFSCDSELEDKTLTLSFNMGTDDSLEMIVTYDEDETEMLVNPYTGLPYDYLVLYNTYPEQLAELKTKIINGDYGTYTEGQELVITNGVHLSEISKILNMFPRLVNKVVNETDSEGNEQTNLIEYVSYEYISSELGAGLVSKITLKDNFVNRIDELIVFYTKYRKQLSLLSMTLEQTGYGWSIGDIYGVADGDYTLANKRFQFEENESIYSFLTQTLAQTTKCVINFDLYHRKVNMTPVELLGEDTGIVLSYESLVNELDVGATDDRFSTRLYVYGSDDLNLNGINFGVDYIEDLSYKINQRDSYGNRLYLSDELAEKYQDYIDYRESKRDEHIEAYLRYTQLQDKIYELMYRVPDDGLKNDWSTFSAEELEETIKNYQNLLTALIAMYKNYHGENLVSVSKTGAFTVNIDQDKFMDYIFDNGMIPQLNNYVRLIFTNGKWVYTPLNDDGQTWSTDTKDIILSDMGITITGNATYNNTIQIYILIKDTIYWHDYAAYMGILAEAEFATIAYPNYGKEDKWTSDIKEKYEEYIGKIKSWETNWSLYGTIELGAKIQSYDNVIKSVKDALLFTEGSDVPKSWNELTNEEKLDYGGQESVYPYDAYMEAKINYDGAQAYLDKLNAELKDMQDEVAEIQSTRTALIEELALTNNFTEDELAIINRLYRDATYENDNILITEIDSNEKQIATLKELLEDGREKLFQYSRPQLTISLTSENLLALDKFAPLWDSFKQGNYMLVQYQDDVYLKLRLIKYEFNPCLPQSNEFSMTFSTMLRSKSEVSDLEELLGMSSGSGGSGGMRTGGTGGGGGGSGTYGSSDDIDITISNTMISQLLNTETFNAKVSDIVLNSIDINTIAASTAKITKAFIGSAEIDEAVINQLKAEMADITVAEIAKASIDVAQIKNLDAIKIKADNIESGTINADNINITNINGAEIKEGTIIAAALSNEAILTAKGTTVFYQPEADENNPAPTANKEGDVWYVTVSFNEDGDTYSKNCRVWDGSAWVDTPLDGEIIRANSITAREIAANSITANEIATNTITADKMNVDDLSALNATIGGFEIGETSIHTDGKDGINNNTQGIYLSKDGQMYIGDNNSHIRYYKSAEDNQWKLDIAAQSVKFGSSGQTIEQAIEEMKDEVVTNLRIFSSKGTVFKSNAVDTVLTVVVNRGSKRITDITTLKQEMGADAYLQWSWQRLNDNDYGVISASDIRISDGGFTFTITPDDVDTKVTFMCELMN